MPELMFEIKRIQRFLGLRTDPANAYLIVILAVLIGAFTLILPGQFFRGANLQSMAFQVPELGVLAIAMMIPLLSGGINLTIIATANMSGILMAFILTQFIPEGASGGGPVMVIAAALSAGLAVSLLIGLLNGWIIAYVGVSPILATLGTMMLIQGLNVVITKGYVISGFPEPVLFIGNGLIFGVPAPLLIFAACVGLVGLDSSSHPLWHRHLHDGFQ